jgi:hypothetical protein
MQEDGVGGGVVQEAPAQKPSLALLPGNPMADSPTVQTSNPPSKPPIVGDDDHGLLPVLQKLFQPGHRVHVQVVRRLIQQ